MERSNLIDVPYALLSQVLSSSGAYGYSFEQLKQLLKERSAAIKRCYNPFGSPSPDSRKKVESGTVKLVDGYEIKLEDTDKKYVLAISDYFSVDECEAVVLFRSCLYNQGIPPKNEQASIDNLVEELLELIRPFYFEERLSLLRILIPLLRARSNPLDPLHELSAFLEELFPTQSDKETFLKNILTQYRRRVDQDLPDRILANPRGAATVARQSVREQLLMLDLVFWLQWDFVNPGSGGVLDLWQLGSNVSLGLAHKYGQLLLDAEAKRLLEDLAAMWILVCIESLNLEPPGPYDRANGEGYLSPEGVAALRKVAEKHQNEWTWAPLATSLALLPYTATVDESVLNPSPFATLVQLMSTSVFSTSIAWDSNSSLCEPSAVSYRSVMRGFLIKVLTRLTIENLPDPLPREFQELWQLVYGGAETETVGPLVRQFWDWDYKVPASPYDIGSGRRGLIEIVRMRFPLQLDLVELLCVMSGAGTERGQHISGISDDRVACANYVFHYLLHLPTFALYVPGNSELSTVIQKRSDKTHTTLRAVSLAGAGTIPPNSLGVLLGEASDGSKIVLFEHQWSGWRFLGEILRGYVRLKTSAGRVGVGRERRMNFATKRTTVWECSVEDLLSGGGRGITEEDVADILDLIRHVGSSLTVGGRLADFVQCLEHDESDGTEKGADIVELSTLILEDSLKKSPASASAKRLVSSCLGVLDTLLMPGSIMASRVWLYLRSSALFTLASTRSRTLISGSYPTTVAILRLISSLVGEQLGSLGTTSSQEEELKSEVLVKAFSYVHHGIWTEHRRWRYDHISEKYEIATLMISTYGKVLKFGSEQYRALVLRLFQASKARDLEWAVETLATGQTDIAALYKARRFADARIFVHQLECLIDFFRALLHASPGSGLESMLCETLYVTKPGSGEQIAVEPASSLAAYVREHDIGLPISLGSLKLLCTLATSEQRIYAHLINPGKTVAGLVRLAGHPFDEMSLRVAAWDFASNCAIHQPALRDLFVFGQVTVPGASNASKARDKGTLMSTALDILQTSGDLWESNPQLLYSVISFIEAVNQTAITQSTFDADFWNRMTFLCCVDLGPAPEPEAIAAIGPYCYRAATKSKALHILSSELKRAAQTSPPTATKQPFEQTVDKLFTNEEQLTDHVMEAISSSFDPQLHYSAMSSLEQSFPVISTNSAGLQTRSQDREFGDNYLYQLQSLKNQLASLKNVDEPYLRTQGHEVVKVFSSLNLNWSLADAQMLLTKAWKTVMIVGARFIKERLKKIVPGLNDIAVTLLNTIGAETRSGPVLVVVHCERLQLLLALFELLWFDSFDDKKDPKHLVRLMSSLSSVTSSDAFPPEDSIRGQVKPEYHHLIFQAIFYLLQRSQRLLHQNDVPTDVRLSIVRNVQTSLMLIMASLNYAFNALGSVPIATLMSDLTLLTSLFAHCTSVNIGLPSSIWSQAAREVGLIGSSLKMLREGADPSLISSVLFFHSTIASASDSAIQLVDEGVIAIYSALSPDAPSDIWCSMVSNVTILLSTLAYSPNFVEVEVASLIQVHGNRIARSLKWTIEEPIIKNTLEETGRIAELFYVLAKVSKPFFGQKGLSATILQALCGPALDHLQQFTYLFTHPNHLASLIEPGSEREMQLLSAELPKDKSFSIGDLFNARNRPATAQYLTLLSEATNALIMALMVIGGSGKVLGTHESEWGHEVYPLLSSSEKVALGDPSSLGTMLQLSGAVSDALREATGFEATAKNGEKRATSVLRCLLETSLTFGATQTVAWMRHQQVVGDQFIEAETDDFGRQSTMRESRLSRSTSKTKQRAFTGDLAADYLSFLLTAQGVLEKTGVTKKANMATFLRGFLEERI